MANLLNTESTVKTKFWEEAPGVQSSTRLFSFILLLFLMGFDFMLSGMPGFILDYSFTAYNFMILIAVFAPKYLHKLTEIKNQTKAT